jgi:hypothetical protein
MVLKKKSIFSIAIERIAFCNRFCRPNKNAAQEKLE